MLDYFGRELGKLRLKARILENGAVLLGQSIVCDAHVDRPIRIVTHAHVDHIRELKKSLEKCEKVIMTPATRDLYSELYGKLLLFTENLHVLEYGKIFEFGKGMLMLFDANHIIGSAQVLVEDEDGTRIVYTGDFRLPEAKIISCDLLVMEATYGNPVCTRPFKERIENDLVELVEQSLKLGSVYIFGYHGKLQEVIGILRKGGIEAPIVAPYRIYQVAKICEKYGMELGEYFSLTSEEGREALREAHIGILT